MHFLFASVALWLTYAVDRVAILFAKGCNNTSALSGLPRRELLHVAIKEVILAMLLVILLSLYTDISIGRRGLIIAFLVVSMGIPLIFGRQLIAAVYAAFTAIFVCLWATTAV